MGLLSLRERRAIDASSFNIASDTFTSRSQSGVNVTFDNAVGVWVAWACATLIADTIYGFPVDVFEKDSSGSPVEVEKPKLIQQPSGIVSARDWRAQAVVAMAFWGNSYGLEASMFDRFGLIDSVEWVNPDTVTVTQTSQFSRPTYALNGTPVESMAHLRRHPMPGSAVGMSPLERQKETIGLAIAARDFASQWFRDGAHPSGLLTTEQKIDQDVATTAKERFMKAIRGRREPAALGSGWKYEPVQAKPADSQLQELSADALLAITGAFRVRPEMIGLAVSGSSVTYANREQNSLDFLTYTMQPWITIFEDYWDTHLPPSQYARFNTGSLLRTDTKARYQTHDLAIRMGLATVNERRSLEDMPPVEGGDERLWPPYRGFPIPNDEE